jgi:hypothetical protein
MKNGQSLELKMTIHKRAFKMSAKKSGAQLKIPELMKKGFPIEMGLCNERLYSQKN